MHVRVFELVLRSFLSSCLTSNVLSYCTGTNILISSGASADSSVILTYNADDDGLFGSLDLRPAADHPPGAMRQIWDWDGQYYTGLIPELNHTYNVVGNTNEWGVVITGEHGVGCPS